MFVNVTPFSSRGFGADFVTSGGDIVTVEILDFSSRTARSWGRIRHWGQIATRERVCHAERGGGLIIRRSVQNRCPAAVVHRRSYNLCSLLNTLTIHSACVCLNAVMRSTASFAALSPITRPSKVVREAGCCICSALDAFCRP